MTQDVDVCYGRSQSSIGRSKRSAGRPKDLLVVPELEALLEMSKER